MKRVTPLNSNVILLSSMLTIAVSNCIHDYTIPIQGDAVERATSIRMFLEKSVKNNRIAFDDGWDNGSIFDNGGTDRPDDGTVKG